MKQCNHERKQKEKKEGNQIKREKRKEKSKNN